jgi:hypothetical protein
MGIDAGSLDEEEEDLGGHSHALLIVHPGAKRDSKLFGQGIGVFAASIFADLAEAFGQCDPDLLVFRSFHGSLNLSVILKGGVPRHPVPQSSISTRISLAEERRTPKKSDFSPFKSCQGNGSKIKLTPFDHARPDAEVFGDITLQCEQSSAHVAAAISMTQPIFSSVIAFWFSSLSK